MKTSILLSLVAAVIVFTGIAYATLPSVAKDAEEAKRAELFGENTAASNSAERTETQDTYDRDDDKEEDDEDESKDEDENGNEDESDDDTSVTTTSTQTVSASGYTLAEVAAHQSESSCWTVIAGRVYDLTSYLTKHSGGKDKIMSICGKDGTAAYTDQHGDDDRPKGALDSFYIGDLR